MVLTAALLVLPYGGAPPAAANHNNSWVMTSEVYNAGNQVEKKHCANIYQAGVPPSGDECSATVNPAGDLGVYGCGLAPDQLHANGHIRGAIQKVGFNPPPLVRWKCSVSAGQFVAIVKITDQGGDGLTGLSGCFGVTGDCVDIGLPQGEDPPADIVWEVFIEYA